jgi:ATP-dependent Clp protease ATP-binding subunit ClpA
MMQVDNSNWTPKAKMAWEATVGLVKSKNHNIINCCHLFCVFWVHSNPAFKNFANSRGIDLSAKKLQVIFDKYFNLNSSLFSDGQGEPSLQDAVKKAFKEAAKIARKKDNFFIGTEHVIYGIIQSDKKFSEFLFEKDIDTEHLKLCIECFISGEITHESNFEFSEMDDDDEDYDEEDEDDDSSPTYLVRFCDLLNEEVTKPNYPKISGRDKEIALMEEILCRKTKSNCILVGAAGTGKTAIVEGLAQLIENGSYKGPLAGKKIYSMDLAALVAGTKYRGELEQRFNRVLDEFKQDQDNIMFIDEIHTIIGAGSKEGSQDLANMLKPALARGEIKCIGATTSTEYKKYFEKDAALSRRFHPVNVDEPSLEHVNEMIKIALPTYEKHHKVKFPIETAMLATKLCSVYLPHQRFPDKAFDVIDQAAAKTRIRSKRKVTDEQVYQVVSDKIHVDVQTLKQQCHKSFEAFEKNITQDVFGQDKNISKIYDVLACAKVGLRDNTKPLASFFFVGPTSVGKTYTAKKVAKEFYGNDKSFLQLNMSEYQDQTSISKLIGANAGYVGYEDGGILTEFARQNPNSLILFDEAEKCHPGVLNLLLQILDEAKLSDNLNRDIDFSRCIVVLTSNIGSREAAKVSMGFVSDETSKRSEYESNVKKQLPPELVARIDEIITFNDLDSDSFLNIFNSQISLLVKTMEKQNINLKVEKSLQDLILNDKNQHARNIKKMIRQEIEVPLAKFIIKNPKTEKITIKSLDGKVNIG